jgi:hypothetical protein
MGFREPIPVDAELLHASFGSGGPAGNHHRLAARGARRGIVAGSFFVIPSIFVLLLLSYLAAAHSDVPAITKGCTP